MSRIRQVVLIPTEDPNQYRLIRSTRKAPLTTPEIQKIVDRSDRGITNRAFFPGSGMYDIVHRNHNKEQR